MGSPKRPWVIKLGGSMLDRLDQKWFNRLYTIYDGSPLILVHGGGKAIDAMLVALGGTPRYHRGLRVTDEATLPVVQMVLSGKINPAIVGMMHMAGFQAIGVSGIDGGIVQARRTEEEGLGYVGHVVSINRALLDVLLHRGYVPIVSPVSLSTEGEYLNINADEVATALALAYDARLWLLSDVPGIYITDEATGDMRVTHELNPERARALIRSGTISGGMIPKVEQAIQALLQGVPEIFIMRGDDPDLLEKYVRGEIVGTRLKMDSSEPVGRS